MKLIKFKAKTNIKQAMRHVGWPDRQLLYSNPKARSQPNAWSSCLWPSGPSHSTYVL